MDVRYFPFTRAYAKRAFYARSYRKRLGFWESFAADRHGRLLRIVPFPVPRGMVRTLK
jgi:hypothetical protein